MMALNASASSIAQLVSHQNLSNRHAPVSLLLSMANSQYQIPRGRRYRNNNRTSNFGCFNDPSFKKQLLNLFSWMASVKESVQSPAMPTSVPVRVAHELLQAGHCYLDVRTPEEFGAGHAPGAVNVPYMFRLGSGMTKNTKFVEEVLAHFRKHDEIIVGCQLGKRSLMAASDLLAAGFTGITDIAGGYAAWLQSELPTES